VVPRNNFLDARGNIVVVDDVVVDDFVVVAMFSHVPDGFSSSNLLLSQKVYLSLPSFH
jgi:hypothetical protein